MTESPARSFLVYLPLWGATFDSEEVGLFAHQVMAYVPYHDEWRQIQMTDVWMERWRSGTPDPRGPAPPPCVVAGPPMGPGDDFGTLLEERGPRLLEDARCAILALRLLKSGWFLTPELAEIAWSDGMHNQRRVGPYRQAMLGGEHMADQPGYVLSVEHLAGVSRPSTELTRLWLLGRQYLSSGGNTAADVAVDNFHRSYGYQMSSRERVAFLFTSVDAMMGGMSARRIGSTKIEVRFRPRLEAALAALESRGAFAGAAESAAWLDDRGRAMRNAVAHGRGASIEPEAQAGYPRLQIICRALLRLFLEFSLEWAHDPGSLRDSLGLSGSDSPVEVFNRALEACSRGERSGAAALTLRVSAGNGMG